MKKKSLAWKNPWRAPELPGQESTDSGAGASTGTAQSESSGAATPCPQTPHCDGFDRRFRGRSNTKALEYKFLYSAQAHCVRCMDFYAKQPGLDKHCKSTGKDARQWAESSQGPGRRTKEHIPDDVEQWLQLNGL